MKKIDFLKILNREGLLNGINIIFFKLISRVVLTRISIRIEN